MRSFASILPGARVKCEQGFIGTVERLERRWAEPGDQPDRMLVRSDDGCWRYSIPLMFVNKVSQGTFHPVVYLAVQPEELVHYVVEAIPEPERAHGATQPRTDEQDPEASEISAGASTDSASGETADEDLVLNMPIAHEELVVRKEPVVLGTIRVHKGVESEEQHVTVPVWHEEAILEHIPPDQYDRKAYTNPNEVIIPIVEERLIVRKQIVVKEYLRIRKTLVSQSDEVHETVRRETVSVTELRQEDIDPRIGKLLRGATDEVVRGDSAATSSAMDAMSAGGEREQVASKTPEDKVATHVPDVADQPTITDLQTDSFGPR